MRQPARRRPSHTSRSPRHRPAQAHAPCRARAADPRAQRLTSTPPQKCSGDFFAKALISLGPPPEFAQVGLGAAFLCAEFGFDGALRQAGYISHWIELLKADKRAFFTACSQASKAADYLRGLAIADATEAAA